MNFISTSWHRPREAREATLGCSRQSEADVSVKLLSSLVEHEARTAFDPHLVGILVVGGQPGERDAKANKLLDRANIDAEAFADLTSHIPARNVPTIPEKRATGDPMMRVQRSASGSLWRPSSLPEALPWDLYNCRPLSCNETMPSTTAPPARSRYTIASDQGRETRSRAIAKTEQRNEAALSCTFGSLAEVHSMIKHYSDHAANERTFLAWVRTAIAVMAFGFLIERFDLFLKIHCAASGATTARAAQRSIRELGWPRLYRAGHSHDRHCRCCALPKLRKRSRADR